MSLADILSVVNTSGLDIPLNVIAGVNDIKTYGENSMFATNSKLFCELIKNKYAFFNLLDTFSDFLDYANRMSCYSDVLNIVLGQQLLTPGLNKDDSLNSLFTDNNGDRFIELNTKIGSESRFNKFGFADWIIINSKCGVTCIDATWNVDYYGYGDAQKYPSHSKGVIIQSKKTSYTYCGLYIDGVKVYSNIASETLNLCRVFTDKTTTYAKTGPNGHGAEGYNGSPATHLVYYLPLS